MSKASAFILKLERDRADVFEEALDEFGYFAEAVPQFSHSRNAPLICFVVNDQGVVTHIASGRRGVNAGTRQSRLNISDINEIETLLSVEMIIDGVPKKNRKIVEDRFRRGGLLTPRAFEEVIDLVARLRPETSSLINRFTKSARTRLARLTRETKRSLGQQKESIATAMLLAGVDREPLQEWSLADDDAPRSFLDGLSQSRMREDQMIIQDLSGVPGYEFIRQVPNASAALFRDEETGHRLTVVLANRLPLEEQTGTDLIYYNEAFRSFVMVQYKAMEPDDKEGSIFRFPEKQLTEEIGRMETFLKELEKLKESGSVDDYRLNKDPFFLKFCPRIQFDPNSSAVTKGMYVPLSYWKRLSEENAMIGPRGGRRLAYSNVRRYFDNSSFASMVRGAWVGTAIDQSILLERWMKRVLSTGRALTFAVKPDDSDPEGASEPVGVKPDLGWEELEKAEVEKPRQRIRMTRE